MKKFLLQLSVFFLLPLVYFGVNMGVNHYFYKHAKPKVKQTRILIIGDSHAQKGINPKWFASANNIAQTAEPYVLSFWKLKAVLKVMHPDTVLIGFAPHNISAFNDLKFSDEEWAAEMFKRCYTIQELKQIDQQITVDYKAYWKTLWKQTAFYPKRNQVRYLGKFINKPVSKLSDCEKTIARHFYLDEQPLGVSGFCVAYLDSIIAICLQHHIQPILVCPPVYSCYLEKIPTDINRSFQQIAEQYQTSGIPVINRLNAPYPDSFFYNSDHLNLQGADSFSKELSQLFVH